MMSSVRLKRIADTIREPADTGEYVGLENVESGTAKRIRLDSDNQPAAAIGFQPGDVLYAKLRPYLRKVLCAGFKGRCSSEFLVLRPRAGLDSRYLMYVMLSDGIAEWATANSGGAKMPRAEWDLVGQSVVNVPSASRQRVIADYLDLETCRIDALIDKRLTLLRTAAERQDRLVSEATEAAAIASQNATHSRSGWRWMNLRRCFRSVQYGIGDGAREEGQIAVLGMGNVNAGQLVGAPIGYVDSVDADLLLRSGDLAFNRTNSLALVAKVAYVDALAEPTTVASYLVIIRTSELADAKYLSHLLNSTPVLGLARSMALPSIGQANLNPNRYGAMRVVIPPVDRQRAVATELDRERNRHESWRAAAERQIALLREKRAAIIAAAVTGRLDIPDAA